MTTDRDPGVGALLDRLPVDPAPPAFWDDVRARLEDDVVRLNVVPVAQGARQDDPRRRRRVVVAVLATAAAVLVAVVAGAALRADRDDLDTGPVDTPPPSVPTPTDPGQDASDTTLDPDFPVVPAGLQRSIDTMAAYMSATNVDDVWTLLGPQSREMYGGELTDEVRGQLSSTREDVHLWQEAEDLTITAVGLAEHDGLQTTIATATATIDDPSDDFAPQRQHWSLLVQDDGNDRWIEPFVPGQALDLVELPPYVEPEGIPPYGPGDTITVHVDPAALGVAVLIDGEPVPDSWYVPGAGGSPVGVRIPQDVHAGEHEITVGMVAADGTIALASYRFEVALPS